MLLEKNKQTRKIVRKLLQLEDRISGVAFPEMERVKQITVYHCGPAVLTALFSNLGITISQTSVVRSLRAQKKIKQFGLNVRDLGRAANALGKKKTVFWKKANGKISDVDLAINKFKSPVGVEWQGVFYEFADEDDGHYAVITKLDKEKKYLRISDPFSAFAGVDRRFSISDFLSRWWDFNEVRVAGQPRPRTISDRRVMFVITKSGETWPRKLGMSKI